MKVILREIKDTDLQFINICRNKYSVSKNLNLFLPKSVSDEIKWVNKEKDEIHFIIATEDNNPIGQVSLINFSHLNRKAEFTIFIDDQYWGKGYGKIATKLMVHYGFSELNLHKIFLHVYEGNENAKKVYESVGFIQEGKLRDFIFKNGKYIDAYIYGILDKDFFIPANLKGIIQPLLYNEIS